MNILTQLRRWGTCALLALALSSVSARGFCETKGAGRRFDITAGAAVARLNQWGEQAGIGLIGEFDKISGLRTRGVKGTYTPEAALKEMTRGTGIVCKYTRPGVMWCSVIEPRRKLPRQAAQAAGPQQTHDPLVLVTGTHIRGVAPAGARRISISREEIAASGFATVADTVRALPQNFGGGPTEDTRIIGRETRTNAGRGTALNLRGLGPAETLVLLNGRRLAPGGTEAAFTDVTSIPLIAVRRIDVVPDSGSALYGSDAIGGVIDIVFDREAEGFESQVRGGLASDGGPREIWIGQRFGHRWDDGSLLLAAEYYDRDRLPASSRRLAHSDLRAFGGDNFDLLQSNPGTIIAGGALWAIPHGQDGTALDAGAFQRGGSNLSDRSEGSDVNPSQRRISALVSAQRTLRPGLEVYADALISRRDAEQRSSAIRASLPVTSINPFYVNPAGGSEPILVAYDFIKDFGPTVSRPVVTTANLALGGAMDLPGKWRLSSYVARALESSDVKVDGLVSYRELLTALFDPNPATAFNPFGDGSHTSKATLARIATSGTFEGRATLDTFNAAADGPLFALPAGTAKLALGAEYRRQTFDSLTRTPDVSGDKARLARDVRAAYAELLMPIAARDRDSSQELTLSLAARFEDHLNVARTTAPKAGLTWSPATGVTLQGTWTSAFRAPNLADLYEGNNSSMIIALPDPRSPSMISRVLAWGDKNADLRPESSHGWTLGLEFGSPLIANGSIAMTYFDIRLRNQFADYALSLDALTNPSQSQRVDRAPSVAERSEICRRSHFVGLEQDCLTSPIDAIVDARVLNNSYLATSGIDLSARKSFDTSAGHFDVRLEGAYVTRYALRDTPTSPLVNLVDTQNHVLRLRTRGTANWQRGALGATAGVNFDGGYKDIASSPERNVDSWTTWDLQLRHDATLTFGAVPVKSRISLSIQNVFDTSPPFLNNSLGFGYDAENADLMGRTMSLQLTTSW